MRTMPILLLPALLMLAGCTVNPQDVGPHASGTPGDPSGAAAAMMGATGNLSGVYPVITMQEVAKHNSKGDCWMVIDGNVLNLTGFSMHPGGDAYVPYCGTEATAAFNDKGGRGRGHSQTAYAMMNDFKIGVAAPSGGN